MAQSKHFNVIIIGSGAGGGTLFHHLAPSGATLQREGHTDDCPGPFHESRP